MDARALDSGRSLRGRPVITADGKRIGKVAETRGEAMKVRKGILRSFWLSAASVCAILDGEVDVSFNRNELPWYTIPDPGKQ